MTEEEAVVPPTPATDTPSSSSIASTSSQKYYAVEWSGRTPTMLGYLKKYLLAGDFVDIVLSCGSGGKSMGAHKVVLAASSFYFEELLGKMDNTTVNGKGLGAIPFVVVNDMEYSDLEAAVMFMYEGIVYLKEDQIAGFLKTAETLKVKGIVEVNKEKGDGSASEDEPIVVTPLIGDDYDRMMGSRNGSADTGLKGKFGVGVKVRLQEGSNGDDPDWGGPDHDKKAKSKRGRKHGSGNSRRVLAGSPTLHYKKYSEEQVKKALEAVENGARCYTAARKFGIPNRTLYDRLKKKPVKMENLSQKTKVSTKSEVLSQSNENVINGDKDDDMDAFKKIGSKRKCGIKDLSACDGDHVTE